MAQTTEAACLLEFGSMYFRRLGLKSRAGEVIFAGVKPWAVSLYFGDAPIYHFDFEGRWQRAFIDGMHYIKGLDATVRSIGREREHGGMVLRRNALSYAEAADLDASIRSTALELIDDFDSGRLDVMATLSGHKALAPERLRTFLEKAALWDSAAWFAHRERYLSAYGPLPFLPPDSSNALVLQATLGHAEGRAFGRAKPAEHYVRTLREFADHARAVRRLVGRRVAQSKGMFLGGADLLHRPIEEILGFLEAARQVFPIGADPSRPSRPDQAGSGDDWDEIQPPLGPIHAFLDDFQPPMPNLEGWKRLKDAQLGRLTLGIESGDQVVRARFGKSWEEKDLRSTIAGLKSAGIGVGLIVLVGAGGRARADSHLDATATLLASLPLESGDLVSLVDARSLDADPVDPLTDEETMAQNRALKERVAAARTSKGPKLVAYNPDKQWT